MPMNPAQAEHIDPIKNANALGQPKLENPNAKIHNKQKIANREYSAFIKTMAPR